MQKELSTIADNILSAINNIDDLPTSDFQALIDAQIRRAYLLGKKAGKAEALTKMTLDY